MLTGSFHLARAQRIAVLRALKLGDLLCAVPALRALRAAAPHASITLIGLHWAHELARRLPCYIDGFMALPAYPGLPETQGGGDGLDGFLDHARACRFDLAIQMHGSGEAGNELILSLGARHTAGYYMPGRFRPDAETFLPWRNDEREVQRWLRLVGHLGAPALDAALEFPLDVQDTVDLHALPMADWLRTRDYVCIHAGAHLPSRRWPARRFAAVADALAARGFEIVLIGGAAERAVVDAVSASMRHGSINLAGATRLGTLALLIKGARLVVGNDTGVARLAVAVGTPSVVVSSGGDAQRWAPLDARRHSTLHHDPPCRPCLHDACPLLGHPCAEGVAVRAVLDKADALLGHTATAEY